MSSAPGGSAGQGNQQDVIAFLSDPANYADATEVRRIDTHAAMVFLAGTDAFKIKRAVAYPFLDFSTLEKRRAACEHEIEVNQQNAPDIYLGVVPITREDDSSLAFAGSGTVVEWAVHMKRFDHEKTLDRIIEDGPLDDGLIDALSHELVQAHARAPISAGAAWINDLRRYVDQNRDAFQEHAALFGAERATELTAAAVAAFDTIEPLLQQRAARGYVRLCHGDAHLGNIALIEGRPVLFDAIEFDDMIATGDVLYDLSFLIMDLWERGHRREANRTFNRYLIEARQEDHYGALAVLPFFLMMRAAIRAKVTAARIAFAKDDLRERLAAEARSYFNAACAFMEREPARLVAVGGLSGSGKSTLAMNIAPFVGQAPGGVVLRSDIVRKHLFDAGETQRLPARAYAPQVSVQVYDHLRTLAAAVLQTGYSVVVDAVFLRDAEREIFAQLARQTGVRFDGLWLDAPADVLEARVAARRDDASDADEAVVRFQLAQAPGTISWQSIDASGAPDQAAAQALKTLMSAS